MGYQIDRLRLWCHTRLKDSEDFHIVTFREEEGARTEEASDLNVVNSTEAVDDRLDAWKVCDEARFRLLAIDRKDGTDVDVRDDLYRVGGDKQLSEALSDEFEQSALEIRMHIDIRFVENYRCVARCSGEEPDRLQPHL